MIVELLHYNFKLLADKVDSLSKKDFNPAEIDEFLNKAITHYVNNILSGYNPLKLAVEDSEYLMNHLDSLVVNDEEVLPLSNTNGVYKFDLNALDFKFLQYARSTVLANECYRIKVTPVEHSKLEIYATDYTQRPSLTWKRALAVFGKDRSLFIHTDNRFEVDKLFLTYYKVPNTITIGGYLDVTGVTKVKTECDLPENLHHKIIDIAVQIAQGVLENPTGFQVAQNQVISNS